MRNLTLCLAACLMSVPAAARPPYFVGSWFGMDQPDIKNLMWIEHWQADGTFRVHFRHCKKGKNQDLRSAGSWSFQGNILTARTTMVDGKPFAVTNVYEIMSHDAQRLKYRELPSRFIYHASHVADDFQMPSCEMTS